MQRYSWLQRFGKGVGWTVFSVFCLLIAAYAFGFLYNDVNARNPFQMSFAKAGLIAPAHFFGAGMALLLAPLQLSGWLRQRWPSVHRTIGWLYVAVVLIGGLAGLALAPRAQGGWPTGTGFALLGLCWLISTVIAVRFAVLRKFELHRRWMLRSVALTFSAVTLRLYLGFGLGVLRLDFAIVYLAAAWLCWTLNLLAIELYLWRQGRRAPDMRLASPPQSA